MWLQVLCLLNLSLAAVRSELPCNCHKKAPSSHSSYYEEDIYYLPNRYGHSKHHHGGYVNVGYKPINSPQNHPETYHDDQKHENKNIQRPYVYEYRLNNRLYEDEHPENDDHRAYNMDYVHSNDHLSQSEAFKDRHDYSKNAAYKIVNPRISHPETHHRDPKDEQKNRLHDHEYREVKRLKEYLQTYLSTHHYNKEDKRLKHHVYEHLLPGILRNLQGISKHDEEKLVTIIANEYQKPHMYPKIFEQTLEFIYNREKQRQNSKHTKFEDFDLQNSQLPNYIKMYSRDDYTCQYIH